MTAAAWRFRVLWVRSTADGHVRFVGVEPIEQGSEETLSLQMRFVGERGESALVTLVESVLGRGGSGELVYRIEGDVIDPGWIGPRAILVSAQ
jgi:hypothetical protein